MLPRPLIVLLALVTMLRESGFFELLSAWLRPLFTRLGIPPERILYSGVNKGADDVARAVALGADLLTAESTLHFDLICAAAAAQGKHVRVLPRLTAGSQFGMDPDALADLVARRAEFPNVTIVGIHYFSGTQKRKDAVIAKELAHLDEYLTMLHERYGFTAQHVEYGPGLNAECFRDDAEARRRRTSAPLGKSTRSRSRWAAFSLRPAARFSPAWPTPSATSA